MFEFLDSELVENAWQLVQAAGPVARETGKKVVEGLEKGIGSELAKKFFEKAKGADPAGGKELERAAQADDRDAFVAALSELAKQQRGFAEDIKGILVEARQAGVLVQQTGAGAIGVVQGDVHYHGAASAPARKRVVGVEAGTPDFVGRGAEIEKLEGLLREGQGAAISAIGGMGGIGKTALALHVSERLRDEFTDRVLVDLRGFSKDHQPLAWQEAMRDIVLRLEPESRTPEDDGQLQAAYHSALDGRRALIIADNARRLEQVAPLRPQPPSAMIVTSRRTIALEGVRHIRLDALDEAEADELLLRALDGREVSAPMRARVAELCARLPLALRAAGSYLARRPTRTVESYIQALEERSKRLADADIDVPASLALSVEALEQDDPGLAERWRMLGVFPGDFDVAAAAAVWGLEVEPAQDAVDELIAQNLLQFDRPVGRLSLHDLMRDLVGETDDAVRARHAEYFEGLASRANGEFKAGHEGVLRGLQLFDRERRNIEAGQQWAAARIADDETAARLARQYCTRAPYLLSLRLPPRGRIAWLEASAKGARQIGHKQGEGVALGNLGLAYAELGETRRAIEFYEQGLVIDREIGDRRGEGNALGNLGVAYAALGETRRAIELYEQRLVIDREIGDRRGEGVALGNLGSAYAVLGETRRAIEFYEQALVIASEIGDRRGEGNASHNIAAALARGGRPDEAIEAAERAVAIFEQIEDPNLGKAQEQLRKLRGE